MGGVHDAVDSQRFPAWEEDYIRPPFRQLARTLRIGKVTGGRGRETRDRRRARTQRRARSAARRRPAACVLTPSGRSGNAAMIAFVSVIPPVYYPGYTASAGLLPASCRGNFNGREDLSVCGDG